MIIDGGKNCGFYTFSDVYFASFNSSLTAIYLRFVNVTTQGKTTCTLETPTIMQQFTSGTWLYANSTMAPEKVCGYFVGIGNSATFA
jgi:hypothetical protein